MAQQRSGKQIIQGKAAFQGALPESQQHSSYHSLMWQSHSLFLCNYFNRECFPTKFGVWKSLIVGRFRAFTDKVRGNDMDRAECFRCE